MNVRIFWVHATECMCAQTKPWFILSSEGVLRNWVRTHANSKGKSTLPEAQRRVEPVTMHHEGQWTLHTTNWAISAPYKCFNAVNIPVTEFGMCMCFSFLDLFHFLAYHLCSCFIFFLMENICEPSIKIGRENQDKHVPPFWLSGNTVLGSSGASMQSETQTIKQSWELWHW